MFYKFLCNLYHQWAQQTLKDIGEIGMHKPNQSITKRVQFYDSWSLIYVRSWNIEKLK